MSERTTTTRRMETAGAGAVPRIGVRVSSLTISAPAPAWTIPLPIPVSMPTSLQRQLQALAASRRRRRRQQNRTGEQEGQVREQEDEEVPRAKVLVKDVSLEVEPGQVLAMLGSSGSGKSTLLNAIAQRLPAGLEQTSGDVVFFRQSSSAKSSAPDQQQHQHRHHTSDAGAAAEGEGEDDVDLETGRRRRRGKETMGTSSARALVGFVRQSDDLLPYLTVRETLSFAAALRLPSGVSRSRRAEIVQDTIRELGLASCADTVVGGGRKGGGGSSKGISGGERRRLSIGCILVTLPSVLIVDEPTTGLDASTSVRLLQTLRTLARTGGRAVVLSIHQPRSDVFALFDRITLLTKGHAVYSGPARALLPYFSLAHALVPPEHTNPLDFVVDKSSIDTRDDVAEQETTARVERLFDTWRKVQDGAASSEDEREPYADLRRLLRSGEDDELAHRQDKSARPERIVISRSISHGSRLATTRSTLGTTADGGDDDAAGTAEESQQQSLRRPGIARQALLLSHRGLLNVFRNSGQLVGFFIQAVVISVVMGLAFLNPPETPSGIQSIKTVAYQSTPAYFYLASIVYVFILCDELVLFDRDREDGLYSVPAAVFGIWVSYLPANVVFPTIYSVVLYFMTGFRRDDLARNLLSFVAECILQMLGAFSYAMLAASVNRSFAQASMLANGFSIPFILSAGYLIVDLPVWVSWLRWISPYFYGFQWIARTQFLNRTFACEGITGPTASQCIGENVLRGLQFNLNTPLFVFPLGLVGFFVVCLLLAMLVLQFYHPGGVKHAKARPTKDKSITTSEKQPRERHTPLPEGSQVDINVSDLNISVTTRTPGKLKEGKKTSHILNDIKCVFPRASVTSIMGPSGAGKSTLLELLGGRLSSSFASNFVTSGTVTLNGQPLGSSTAALCAYVEQHDDYHLPALTVRETLRYAATLQLRDRTCAQRNARAEEVLRMLGLKPCADNLVGGDLVKGISGGEKRRLSLALAILADPPVLLADEPLSGLDAFTAHNVMTLLKEIADSGRTVIVSVHQPRSDIFHLFDQVLLMAKGGVVAYSGARDGMLKVFEAAGLQCPEHFNPADFVLDAITVNDRNEVAEAESKAAVGRVIGISHQLQSQNALVEAEKHARGSSHASFKRKTAPFLTAFPVVLERSFKNLYRQQDALVARIANPPFLALLFFLFFGRLSLGPGSIQTRVGLLQETTALPFVGMLSCLSVFPMERNLFYHEWKTSARYSAVTLWSAYSVQEVVVSIVSSCLFTLVFVLGIGLQSTAKDFLCFWVTVFALLNWGESVGISFSTYFENGGLAVALVSAFLTLLSQLNGIISVTMPYFLEVIGWASPMKPQAYVEIINEMDGLVFDCTPEDLAQGACIAGSGAQLLDTFGIDGISVAKLMGILVSLIAIYRLLALLLLKIRVSTL